MMNEVIDEVEMLECLRLILDVLIEEVAREEILLRPPGDGDIRWVGYTLGKSFWGGGERSRSS
jgi:hypothetical protein